MNAPATVAVINIPPVGSYSQTDLFLDPAQQVLLEAEEAKKRRKKEETKIALEKIHGRINDTLNEFECHSSAVEVDTSKSDVNFQLMEDPLELYEMLSDPRMRVKYQQNLTVFIVGYEEMCESRQRLLESLQDFFLETQAGSTQQMLNEVAADEINFIEVTQGLESALKTAQDAAQRLLEIKHEMGQLFSIVATYPDTKKGRKKLEKALLKSQEEVQGLSNTLQAVQGELEQSKEKCDQLQKQVESKSAECTKLRKAAEQMKKLQVTNDSLQMELTSMQAALRKAQIELEKLQSAPVKTEQIVKEVVKVDEGKVCELEAALSQERETLQKVLAEKVEMEEKFRAEIESLRAEHESEVKEMRGRYEDQLKSLMEEDLFDVTEDEDMEAREEEEEGGGASPVEAEETGMEDDGKELEGETVVEASKEEPLMSSSYVGRVKTEGETRERKLRDELNDVKAKSRKTVTALRAQLAEAENTYRSEMGSLKKEMSDLNDHISELEHQNESLQEQLSVLEEQKQQVECELQQTVLAQQEQQALVDQLQQEMESATGRLTAEKKPLGDLVNRSVQWSQPSGKSTPRSLPPDLSSSVTIPQVALPMDEVPFEDDATLQFGSPAFFPSSLQQSVTSFERAPFGSPLHSASGASNVPARPPIHSILAQSRLSHHSTSPQLHLTFDHPVVTEWMKAYDMMTKFKNAVVELLSEYESTADIVEDLKSLEVHTLDRGQEVPGEITQMRFSLALMLHQMEQTLQESFARVGLMDRELGEEREDGTTREEELREVTVQLKRRLRQTEETHKIELQESKETIANLSNKVENLKMEMATLRQSLPQTHSEEGGSIMFTRLDSERNKRTLKAALEDKCISPTTYHKVSDGMEEYLSIPTKQLAHLTRHCLHKTTSSRLIEHVKRSYSDSEHAAMIVQQITNLDEKRRVEFSNEMEQLSVRRVTLAHSLTHTLSHIEKKAQVFLIKPVYATPRGPRSHALITPIARALPLIHNRPTAVSRPRSTVTHSDRSTPHPNMRLVSGLLQSRQSQRGEQGIASCTGVSGHATPHARRHRGESSTEPEWSVEASRAPHLPPSPPTAPPSSLLPRMLELEILRQRQPDTLLGHLLPHRAHHPHTHTTPPFRTSPKRLENSQLTTADVIIDSPLPPIHIPSKVDGPLTVA